MGSGTLNKTVVGKLSSHADDCFCVYLHLTQRVWSDY